MYNITTLGYYRQDLFKTIKTYFLGIPGSAAGIISVVLRVYVEYQPCDRPATLYVVI